MLKCGRVLIGLKISIELFCKKHKKHQQKTGILSLNSHTCKATLFVNMCHKIDLKMTNMPNDACREKDPISAMSEAVSILHYNRV